MKPPIYCNKINLRIIAGLARKYNIRIFYDTPYRKYKPDFVSHGNRRKNFDNFMVQVESYLVSNCCFEYIAQGRIYCGHSLKIRIS